MHLTQMANRRQRGPCLLVMERVSMLCAASNSTQYVSYKILAATMRTIDSNAWRAWRGYPWRCGGGVACPER
jgi:hypothetical protein